MPLGTEVGLSLCDIVLDGTQLPQKKGHHTHPIFGPCLLWPNGWDATWYGSRPRPRPHCIRWGSSSQRKGHSSPPSFRPMSIVTTVSYIAELLLNDCMTYYLIERAPAVYRLCSVHDKTIEIQDVTKTEATKFDCSQLHNV